MSGVKVLRRDEGWGSQLLWVISNNFLFLGISVFLFFLKVEFGFCSSGHFIFAHVVKIWKSSLGIKSRALKFFLFYEIRVLFFWPHYQCPCLQIWEILLPSIKSKNLLFCLFTGLGFWSSCQTITTHVLWFEKLCLGRVKRKMQTIIRVFSRRSAIWSVPMFSNFEL